MVSEHGLRQRQQVVTRDHVYGTQNPGRASVIGPERAQGRHYGPRQTRGALESKDGGSSTRRGCGMCLGQEAGPVIVQ